MRTLFWGTVAGLTAMGSAAMGATTPYATLPYGMASFAQDPNQPIIYASVPSQNAVAVIDANTLAITKTIGVGANPGQVTLSPDGSRLYVANTGASTISVINTATQTALTPITLSSGNALGVQYGTNNRLWVQSNQAIQQLDATTGASTGPSLGATAGQQPLDVTSGGSLRISPDRQTLYFGTETAVVPANLYKYDVSGTNPNQLWGIETGTSGRIMELSHDGKTVVHVDHNGNGGGFTYAITPYRTSDHTTTGTLATGPYPYSFAFSPDDQVGFAGTSFRSGEIQLYDLSTSAYKGHIIATNDPIDMFVDNSGKYLFADVGNATEVLSTDPNVPEPTAVGVLAVGGMAWLGRRGRRE